MQLWLGKMVKTLFIQCVGCWDKKKVNGYDNTSIYSLYINGNKVCHAYDRKTFLEVINDLYNRGIIQM